MAEFIQTIHNFNRFCLAHIQTLDGCRCCPLNINNNHKNEECVSMLMNYPEESETVLNSWVERNPPGKEKEYIDKTWNGERPHRETTCSMCGKTFDIWDEQEGFGLNYYPGYGSKYDLTHIKAQFCCQCFDNLIDYIADHSKTSPVEGDDVDAEIIGERTTLTKEDITRIIGGI